MSSGTKAPNWVWAARQILERICSCLHCNRAKLVNKTDELHGTPSIGVWIRLKMGFQAADQKILQLLHGFHHQGLDSGKTVEEASKIVHVQSGHLASKEPSKSSKKGGGKSSLTNPHKRELSSRGRQLGRFLLTSCTSWRNLSSRLPTRFESRWRA